MLRGGRSQEKRILAWLKSGRTLTPLEALRMFGCMRLGARIYKLRKRYLIKSRLIHVGRGKRVARYVLVP